MKTTTTKYNHNNNVRKFPGNLIAEMFGFEQRDYFEADSGAKQAPKVNFGGDK